MQVVVIFPQGKGAEVVEMQELPTIGDLIEVLGVAVKVVEVDPEENTVVVLKCDTENT